MYFPIQVEDTSSRLYAFHLKVHIYVDFVTPRRLRDADPLNQTSASSLFNPFNYVLGPPFVPAARRMHVENRQTVANASGKSSGARRGGRKSRVPRIPPRHCCSTAGLRTAGSRFQVFLFFFFPREKLRVFFPSRFTSPPECFTLAASPPLENHQLKLRR